MKLILILFALIVLSLHPTWGQRVVINEVMSSNFTTIQDEDGDAVDWIEIYNPGSELVDLNGYGLSDDNSQRFKWILPLVVLQPKEFMLVFASGKDRKEIMYWKNMITQGDIWKYKVDAVSVSTDWINASYDDALWLSGPSGFGFGDNDDATDLIKATSVFLRKSFQISDAASVKQIVLNMDYDDAFVAYLNGVEIARANIGIVGDRPASNALSKSSHEAVMYSGGVPDKFQVQNIAGLLKNGNNVLAIQVHNSGSTSADFTAIPFLTLAFNTPVAKPNGLPSWFDVPPSYLHTNFSIKAAGEFISLCSPDGQVLDSLHTISLSVNQSYGRFPDGTDSWMLMSSSTPKAANKNVLNLNPSEKPVFSVVAGFYTATVSLSLSSPTQGGIIYYTLDGKEPNEQSAQYQSAISISKTTTVRAKCFAPDFEPSDIATQTYLINETTAMPVVSVTTDPFNLYDTKYGIFIYSDPYLESNLFQDWERPVNVQFFETDHTLSFNIDAGVKVNGGLTRGNAEKSLAFFARKGYGTEKFNHQIFPDKNQLLYKSFIIRNSGNDWRMTMFRTGLMNGIVRDVLDLELSAYRPSIAFLNGGYYGIANIQEKINTDFLENNTKFKSDQIDFLEYIHHNSVVQTADGSADGYNALLGFINTHDLTDSANYQVAENQIDINNYISYQLTQIYFDNSDWPGNNIKWWRPNAPVGKWRWVLADTDFGYGLSPFGNEVGDQLLHYKHNTLDLATAENGDGWPNPPYSTFLFRNLLKNEKFKQQFILTFCDQLNTSFQAQRVIPMIDNLKAIYQPEIARFNQKYPECAKNWTSDIEVLRAFANNRVSNQFTHIMTKFGLTKAKKITLDVDNSSNGNIQINTVVVYTFPWSGSYFSEIPVRITAMPKPGYQFTQWSDGDKSPEKIINLSSNQQFIAQFTKSTPDPYSVVINEINCISDSASGTPDWVEFYNNSEVSIDLSQWVFKDSDDAHQFVFPANTIIQPRGYIVLSQNAMRLKWAHPGVKTIVGDMNFKFLSAGETLRLFDSKNQLIDLVTYTNSSPWPDFSADKLKSLELTDPSRDNLLGANWEISASQGGTPGAKNSGKSTAVQSLLISSMELKQNYPNPFDNSTTISVKLGKAEKISLVIFDLSGRIIKTLANNTFEPGSYDFTWNGMGDSGRRIQEGIYIYRLSTDHEQQTRKLILM